MEHACSQLGSGTMSNGRMTAEDAKTSEDWNMLAEAAGRRCQFATSLKRDVRERSRVFQRFCRMKARVAGGTTLAEQGS